MEEQFGNLDALNQEQDIRESLIPEKTEGVLQEPQPDKQELEKLQELARNYKIRAEKAESILKETHKEVSPQELSVKDLTALVKNNVSEDDYDDIFDYARLKKISVAEALKSPVVRAILSEKEEMRRTATATATGNKIQGVSAPSPEELLQKAQATGTIPESDEDIEKLISVRLTKNKK